MNANLRNFFIWIVMVLLLLAVFTFFQGSPPVRPVAPPPAPHDGAQWLQEVLTSWLPFIVLIGVWFFMAGWMRRRPGRPAAPTDAMLEDPTYWRGRADAARALAERLADLQSKRQMLEIVRGYAYLAQRADERRRGPDTPT